MRNLSPLAIAAFIVDFLLLGIGASHLPSIVQRSKVPFEIVEARNQVVVDRILDAAAAPALKSGDEIVSWNGKPVRVSEYLMFAADCDSIGTHVELGCRRGDAEYQASIELIPFYASIRFVVVSGLVGLAFWFIGLFILLNRPNEHAARILHWSIILMGATLFMTQGRIVPHNIISVFDRALFLLVYPLMGATFLYFSTLFPNPKFGTRWVKATVIFAPALFCAVVMISLVVQSVATRHPDDFARFQESYDVCHFLLMLYGMGTIASLVHSFLVARTKEERHKLQWMMWGFAVGPTPFIVLIIIPQLLLSVDLVAEEYATLFLIVVPFTLAISFLKYQIMDIGILINRSIVYAVLTIFVGAIYGSVALLVVSAIGGARISEEYFTVVALALAIAILLNPLRTQVQRFVDATLFPARSKYREFVREISTEFHKTISVDDLFRQMVHMVERHLPVSMAAAYSYHDGVMSLQAGPPSELPAQFHLTAPHARAMAVQCVYVSPDAVRFRREDVDGTQQPLLSKLHIAAGVPLLGETGDLLGLLIANPRLDTRRFDEGEIDLLLTIGRQAEGTMERLRLQEQFFVEREGKKHAEELNRLKSYFVSSVSHELRTPLTSIRMFAETLRDQEGAPNRKRREYLAIVVGEAERLGRLVNNILDFSRIELGAKEFHFAKTDFLKVVGKAVASMKYQVTMDGGSLRLRTPKRLPSLVADADALQEVVMNLVSNALKYSGTRKEILLTTRCSAGVLELSVADKGIGIAESELPHIFEQFYRVRDGRSRQVGGVGLGLTVVKHIVDAHRGTISVDSVLGKGTKFVIKLPLENANEDHSHR